MKKSLFVVGPTASGKSRLALELAVALNLPILNGDSIQMYKGLKIGSALPSVQDLKLASHYLYAFIEKGQNATAADFVENVRKLLQQKSLAGKNLIICGGSGFYLQALEKGMYAVEKVDPVLNAQIDELIERDGWEKIHERILQKDPSLRRTIHLNDHYRIRRALELILLSEKSPEDLKKELTPSPLTDFTKMKIGLFADKELLRKRVAQRAEKMLADGFIEEVEELCKKGYAEWSALQSVGYREVMLYLRGELTRDELLPSIVLGNMKLIKKQLTWFKKDTTIKWFHLDKLAQAKDFACRWFEDSSNTKF